MVCVLGSGGSGTEMDSMYQLTKEKCWGVCVCWWMWGGGRGLRWAAGTNLSKKTMCVCVLRGGGGVGESGAEMDSMYHHYQL